MVIPKSLYLQIISSVPIACVDVAIIHQGSVLLVKRNDPPAYGEWWLPGGRVYKGEMMREAAERKAYEEVGIRCKVGPIVHTAETIFEDGPENIPIHSINSCFLLYPVYSPIAYLDKHHDAFKWVSKIPDNLHPYVVKCLENVGIEK